MRSIASDVVNMTKELNLYTFNSGDIRLQIFCGEGDQKEESVAIPVNRLEIKADLTDGMTDGILEIGTAIYDKDKDFFDTNDPMDFFIYPKKWTVKDPIIGCYDIRIKCKKVLTSLGTVFTQYTFSNRPDDGWKVHRQSLPDNQTTYENAVWRMVRALEGIQKTLNNPYGSVNPLFVGDITLTIEEYTDLVLNGNLPARYRDINKEE